MPPVKYEPSLAYNWDGYSGCRSTTFLDDGLAENEVDEDRPY
jgi:hypothetical protein